MNWLAPWIRSAREESLVAFESSSTQIGAGLPVVASMTTIGSFLIEPSLRLSWFSGRGFVLANAASLSSPGTLRVMTWPGLKPSLALYGAEAIGTPSLFCGIAASVRFRRLPVAVDLSVTV